MICSMTGFGRCQAENDWGFAIWEIRSINHRYLEINLRLPEILRELEQNVRTIIHQMFQRGKIECSLRFHPGQKFDSLISINHNLLNQLIAIIQEISTSMPQEIVRLELMQLLAFEGVVVEKHFDLSPLKEDLLSLFKSAAKDLQGSRKREGENLATGIQERIKKLTKHVKAIQKQFPVTVNRQRQRLMQRFEEVKLGLDTTRLEQEMLYYAQKMDISEELDRTTSHLKEVSRILKKEEGAGRKLDFMMQELNREANTLASKSTDAFITHTAVEMKVLIEQIREQVQNIE